MSGSKLVGLASIMLSLAACDAPVVDPGDDGHAEGGSLTSSSPCLSGLVPTSFSSGVDADVNREANDMALIASDAMSSRCVTAAAATLYAKLKNTLDYAAAGGTVTDPRSGQQVHPLRSWLWGTVLTHAYVAALELEKNGIEPPDLLLQRARDAFASIPVPQDPYCGVRDNSCMDDFTLTASAFAWIAAYEVHRGRPADVYVDRARSALTEALRPMGDGGRSICIYRVGSNPVSCTARLSEVQPGVVEIIGVDHGQENPAYGAGLMMGIGSACAGLYVANRACSFSADEMQVLHGLALHAQRKALPDGSAFRSGPTDGCILTSDPTVRVSCADASLGYLPTDFPLSRFYDKKVSSIRPELALSSADGFLFNQYSEPRTTTARTSFWGYNRKAFYQRLGFSMWPPAASPDYPYRTTSQGTLGSARTFGVQKTATYVNLLFGPPTDAGGAPVTYYVRVKRAWGGALEHVGYTTNTWYTLPADLPIGNYTWDVVAVAVGSGGAARYSVTGGQPLALP